mgnify:CR=1 FL=1
MAKRLNEAVEIRWHGRGGQGAKTACLLLADVAFSSGKHVQGFPEYGPERMGAPITAYNRITDEHCKVHSNIYKPDYVVVVDETLLKSVDVTKGLKEKGALIINSKKSPEEIRPLLKGYKGKVCTIDAEKISMDALGKNFPNTPMLGAVVKVSHVIDQERFIYDKYECTEEVHGRGKGRINMKTRAKDINEKITWQELTTGVEIYEPATSRLVETGDWRVDVPVFKEDKCKQCLLCVPFCPDSSIPVKDGKRLDFDFKHCKGCGICVAVCPFDAIDFVKEEK